MKVLIVAAAAACLATPVFAQDSRNETHVNPYVDAIAAAGYATTDARIPRFEFADAGSATQLNGQVSALEPDEATLYMQVQTLNTKVAAFVAQQKALTDQVEQETRIASRGIAMASSLALHAPAPGSENRIGFGVGTFQDENAVSVNYTRQAGKIDMGFAAAFSGGDKLAKGSVGFSW